MEHKYKKFRFHKSWHIFIEKLSEDAQKVALFDAIARYGIDDIEPKGLEGEALRYFDDVVRPNLDKQHQAKSIRNKQHQADYE